MKQRSSWYAMTAGDLVTHLGIISVALVVVAPGLVRRGEVGGIGTTICVIGAAATAALAIAAYLFARRRDGGEPRRLSPRDWIAKRGIVYVLSQAPVAAIYAGFFFRVVPFGLAAIFVIVSFLLLFVWASYRRTRSTDPDEPVHHLHRYVLWALVPCVLFSVARIPTHQGFGFAYWHPWYDFGSELTGLAPHHYPSLLAGAVLYTLDGLVLTIGYYVLFRRHSLTNAVLYICLYISSIYCFTFPAYGRIGMPSPPMWHAVVFWAHFAMAIGAWYMPRFFRTTWPRLRGRGRATAISLIGAIVLAPYSYAAYEASEMQWPKQQRLDGDLLDRALVAAPDLVAMTSADGEARYTLAMRVGPRSYTNWVNRTRVLGVKDLAITARLVVAGKPIAWCAGHASELEDVNEATFDPDFMARVRAGEYAQVPVHCAGPPVGEPGRVAIEWRATATLIGDRESAARTFHGTKSASVTGHRVVASN